MLTLNKILVFAQNDSQLSILSALGYDADKDISQRFSEKWDTMIFLYAPGENIELLRNRICMARTARLKPYVASLPAPPTANVDVTLQSISREDLIRAINYPMTPEDWEWSQMLTELGKCTDENGRPTAPAWDAFLVAAYELLCTLSGDRRDIFISRLSDFSEGVLTPSTIKEELARIESRKELERISLRLRNLTGNIERERQKGNLGAALQLLTEGTAKINASTKQDYLRVRTSTERKKSYANKLPGIETGFLFGEHKQERLIIPSGALTVVGAPTSHGKTRFLLNLCLDIIKRYKQGSCVYITLEESQDDVELKLLNIYCNERLSDNNLRSIQSYYVDGSDKYIIPEKRELFKQKEAEFDAIMDAGRIRVFYPAKRDISTVKDIISTLCISTDVKAVFVDYFQLLRKESYKGSDRKGELAAICEELMSLSVELQKPIILGAQVNREALSPLEIEPQDIADASNIEHSTNLLLLLWDSTVKPRKASRLYYTDTTRKELSEEANMLYQRGLHLGDPGTQYATIAKWRGGQRYLDAVFDVDGNAGTVTNNPNDPFIF